MVFADAARGRNCRERPFVGVGQVKAAHANDYLMDKLTLEQAPFTTLEVPRAVVQARYLAFGQRVRGPARLALVGMPDALEQFNDGITSGRTD